MIGRRLLRAAVLLLPAAFTACTLLALREHRTQTTYLLGSTVPSPPASGEQAAKSPAPVTLLVSRPQARPGFDTPRMAYLPHPGAVRYYAYHEWADTPARMLKPLVVDALVRSGCCRAVVGAPTSVPGDFRLDIEDLYLGQEFFSTPSVARVSFRALLIDLRTGTVVAARRFDAAAAAPSEDAPGGAEAAGRATSNVLRELSKWLVRSIPPQPTPGTAAVPRPGRVSCRIPFRA